MDSLIIRGGNRLEGVLTASGAKNAALPILAASFTPTDMLPSAFVVLPITHAARTVILFAVSVPVLSVQIVVTEPIVSHPSRCFTRLCSLVIF